MGINRNIMECKFAHIIKIFGLKIELIETLWRKIFYFHNNNDKIKLCKLLGI